MLRRLAAPAIVDPQGAGIRIELLKKIESKGDDAMKAAISKSAFDRYGQYAKELQITTVFHLARGKNTFLHAGTGFGKSRIPEIYHTLLPKTANGVILVLNPLDALGDNQVLEKKRAGFSAINLTKLTFNVDEANKVVNGTYNFVYLSPEIFLNSRLWDQVYFCPNFQNRLALVVIDEAHIIYQWGLVESSTGKKKAAAVGRIEDIAIFRPCYGKMGGRLLTRNNKPILLMSATCRPVAVAAIKKSLKFEDHNVCEVRGELTRPEIRIIRVPITSSMASGVELEHWFAPQCNVPNEKVVPTLIYSSTRNRTLQVMKVVDDARGTPGGSMRPNSLLVRRFHSCTGEKDKLKVVEDFAANKFPMISCTMALGMGQNWSRVRRVMQLGRGDPSAICQMVGRAGRDGRPGVAILFVEKTRKGGKNKVAQFDLSNRLDETDRMDALAITPVCLRIAFAIDNALGYIPLSLDDPSYMLEKQREQDEDFGTCCCSNCRPDMAVGFINNIKDMTIDNFEEFLEREWEAGGKIHRRKRKRSEEDTTLNGKHIHLLPEQVKVLSVLLREGFDQLFSAYYSKQVFFGPEDIFRKDHITSVIENLGKFSTTMELRKLIGGEVIPGQMEMLLQTVQGYINGQLANENQMEMNRARVDHEMELERAQEERDRQAQEEARLEKDRVDEERRIFLEARLKRAQVEDAWKAEQAIHMAMLVRMAGEDAERRGVESIHRGR